MNRRKLFLILCMGFTCKLSAQVNILQRTDSLDNYINKHLSSFELPGLAIGIIKDGAVYYQKGYGVKSRG